MSSTSANVRSRGEKFTPRIETKITREIPAAHNPYLVRQSRLHGYDHLELMRDHELSDVIFLLFRGELPDHHERQLFRRLMIGLINPGPRHPATQASITAGVGKTMSVNVLPIALSIFGGEFDGAATVEDAMRFLRRASRKPARDCAESDATQLPGFGTLYGDPDPYAEKLLYTLVDEQAGKILRWAAQLHEALRSGHLGILKSGLCAAVLADLGFQPRQGNGLMQLMAAPGLLAHGVEFANKPLTSMLFEPDDCYEVAYACTPARQSAEPTS
ncbi:citrate synthase [Exilibacterium tricleocarpae]|uniref:Citrate synthase n=1 Tax=Exilibacterium tricleocarpae TaxID=2591008 RepID=A0A545U5C0_9GAMM|nr:citrate synthase [Exilibacterium tricleocarpae]TQV84662.1 citrate synthase [Exilibacterium tricleocarpae]